MHMSLEILMEEHRVIEGVAASLLTFVGTLEEGTAERRATLARYVEFFRGFADGCHHCKEEDLLFVRMIEFNFPKEFGPLAVMNEDHKQARAFVSSLAEVSEARGPLSGEEIEKVRATAGAYVELLLGHILKEDNVLYPMAQQALPEADVLDAMLASYSSFEEKAVGKNGSERLRALADSLKNEYPPRLGALQPAACAGCSGHDERE